MVLDLVDGALDEPRLVEGDAQDHAGRQGPFDLLQFLLDRVDDLHGVRARLLLHAQGDGGDPVEPCDGAFLLEAVLGASEIPDPYGGSAEVGDDQVVEVGDAGEFPLDLDGVFLGAALDPAPGQFHVLLAQGLDDVACRDLVGPELVLVKPDPHLPQPQPGHVDGPDALHLLDLFLQDLVGVGRQVSDGALPGQVHPEHRGGVGIHLLDDRLVDVLREAFAGDGDLLPDVLNGQIDVALQDELDGHDGDTLAARRADRLDAVDRVDRLLDLVGHVDVHDLGARALEAGRHVDDGKVHLRE